VNRLSPKLPPGYRLVSYDSVGSTNDEAKGLARDGAAAGTLVWALEQSAGRGRRGRVWASPRGNLYASLILRPDCSAGQAAQLGFAAALAVGGALGAIFPPLERLAYKWPNDVLLSRRKIAGILLESEMNAADELTFLVVGVGVNLMVSPRDTEYPATSVAEEGLGEIMPAVMLEEFSRHFHAWEKRWRKQGFAPVREAWRMAAISRGEPVCVRLERETLHGRFLDIDEGGALLLESEGRHRRVSAGEVFPATAPGPIATDDPHSLRESVRRL
jgi:BirA family transcriptional regulator, biotin operon repressor / biotin---[acetyl-CoA-carboxylase] ligase